MSSSNIEVRPPEREGVVNLPDGRKLAWGEWGSPSAKPLLFCGGAGMSRAIGLAVEPLTRRGFRLVSVDRPGLGASSPAPGRQLGDFAADVRSLAEARGLESMCILGYSQGAPFALACAASGLVTSVAVVAGTDELAHVELQRLLPPEVAKLVTLSVSAPAEAEALFGQMTAAQLGALVMNMSSEADRAIFGQVAFAALFERALEEAFSQGSAGYARDTVLSMRPWPFELGSIRVPVHLWYGCEDTSPVHSPDFGVTLARRLPHSHLHQLEGAGSALLWTHTQEILEALT